MFIEKEVAEMSRVCYLCKKNEAGKPQDITFQYKGFDFTIFKPGLVCEGCEKERFMKLVDEFNKYKNKKLVTYSDGKLFIDWSLYVDTESSWREDTYSADIKNGMTDILEALGILTIESAGNYEVISAGPISLNPRAHIMELYFTHKEDAISYAKLKYANAQYNWEVRQIGEVIKKKEILKN